MSLQFLTAPTVLSKFVVFNPSDYPTYTKPIQASSLDYGFDFEEEELGRELLTPLPVGLAIQPNDHIEADQFESLFRWFNS